MTFRNGRYWWTRIPTSRGVSVRRSLRTANKARADQLARMIGSWRDQARWVLLDALACGELSLDRAFDAYQSAAVDRLVSEIVRVRDAGALVVPLVAAWEASLIAGGQLRPATLAAYVRQVRALVGPEPVRVRELTREWIRARLAALRAGGVVTQTNRYHSALSVFCRWLVDEGHLERSPMLEVPRRAESAPRDRHLSREDALRVLAALPEPFRAMHAVMSGTGMEVSAVCALRYRDIDRERRALRARGTKRRHRDRTVRFFPRWEAEWDLLERHLAAHPGVGDALVFAGQDRYASYAALMAACAALAIADYRQHDWRHTYTVQAIRDRMPDHLIAHQLGHANTLMVQTVYGRFRVTAEDLDAWTREQAGEQHAPARVIARVIGDTQRGVVED